MKKAGVFVKRGLIGILAIALIATGGGAYYFKSYLPNTVAPKSFPQIDGQIRLEGLDATVDIYRDKMGIPNIYATTQHDLFFAEGYIHAQDRFWQMDVYRHIGSGRVSEMFGKGRIQDDSFLTTLGWRATAEQEYAGLDANAKSIMTAYADGVNAYLKNHSGEALNLEYSILKLLNPDYKIQPWEPVNSITWGKALAWDLRHNIDDEIQRAILLKTLTPEQVAELYPAYPSDHPVIVNNMGGTALNVESQKSRVGIDVPISTLDLEHLADQFTLLDSIVGPQEDGIGSNSWVVSGSRTSTGMPILANDPHLGIAMPSIWYQVGLHCKPKSAVCPFEVAGFSLAGGPGVIIGHNDHIAWGFTFSYEDVMDLFIEKVNPDNPNQYEVNGQWVDFDTRKETIHVAGSDPVELTVRSTRHGPVISDVFGPLKNEGGPKDKEFIPFKNRAGIDLPQNYVIALSWTALSPSTPWLAVWGFDTAENFDQFRAAARYLHVPGQNLAYADIDGNIGYQASGDIPIRKKGDGSLPVPGWTSDYDWTGYIPFDEMPYTLNPVEGYIAPANNKMIGDNYSHFITSQWDYGFRADRIVRMIKEAPGKIDISYIQKMQGDDYDANAALLVPILMNVNFNDSHLVEVRSMLKDWNYQAQADSAPAALYEVFWKNLLADTFKDELPERYLPSGGDRWYEVTRHIIEDVNSTWWDDKMTNNIKETRDDIFARAFKEAVSEIEKTLGKDTVNWKWGDLHTAVFRNGTLGSSGIPPIDALFNRGPFPVSGGKSIVNATSWDATKGFGVTNLPSMRMIVDLSDLGNSLTVHTTGQSGHAYNKHYIDMASMWASIQYYPMLWDESSVTQIMEGHLVLQP